MGRYCRAAITCVNLRHESAVSPVAETPREMQKEEEERLLSTQRLKVNKLSAPPILSPPDCSCGWSRPEPIGPVRQATCGHLSGAEYRRSGVTK
jgi:hypothetical protein